MIRFPESFVWGTATSAFQIEGATKADGRGESIWDRFCYTEGKVKNGDTGDIACDHFHLYQEDVRLMRDLHIQSYRFSISWPRIFPQGTGQANLKGLDFYKRLIDQLLKQGIEPMATIYHWDLPQALEDQGGWQNREMVDHFEQYASFLYEELGDVVKKWITHNEPWVVAYLGYGNGEFAPGIKGFEEYLRAAHHVLLSHGKSVSAFREKGPKDGQIGITFNLNSTYAGSPSREDQEAARRYDGFLNRWYLDPVFKGEYPKDMLDLYLQKYNLDFVQDGDLKAISQPIDFLGINYYSIMTALDESQAEDVLKFQALKTGRPTTAMDWEIEPNGLFDLLVRINKEYCSKTPIFITENGAAFEDQVVNGEIMDDDRLDYIKQHLQACHKGIEHGINVSGYYVWSLLDNFEWASGYEKRFGIVHVDFDSLKRTPKKSALWYKEVISNQGCFE